MYHTIVKRKLRNAFEQINSGVFEGIIADFATDHTHEFFGDHALAGRRTRIESTRDWYQRLSVLLPDLRFEVKSILVSGFPWDTVAAVEWVDHFTAGGQRMSNQGVHMLRLKWGRVVGLAVHCDTQKLEDVLALRANDGVDVARAAPIADPLANAD